MNAIVHNLNILMLPLSSYQTAHCVRYQFSVFSYKRSLATISPILGIFQQSDDCYEMPLD